MTAPQHTPQAPAMTRQLSRRAVTKTGLNASVVAALAATALPQVAHASATPVPTDQVTEPGPARYTLTGEQIAIEFIPGDGAKPPQLTYQGETGSSTFTGDEIDLGAHRALGRIASVILSVVNDAYVDYLAILLPEVNPDDDSTDVPITTVAIVIRHLTSIGGPRLVNGPLQTYDVRLLSGTATFAPA